MKFLFNAQDEILDNLPDAIFALNYERKILFCNKAAERLLGYTSREIKGMHITQICEQGSEGIYDAMINNRKNPINVKTKGGQALILEVTAYDSESKQQVMVCARDVTETHTIISNVIAEYKVNQEKCENRNAFIVDVSSEFEKPMNSIIGFAQALLEGVGGELSEKQDKYLNIITKNALALHSTLDAVIDITKLDANKMPVEKRVFDITNVINLVSQAFTPAFDKKEIEFKLKLTGLETRKVYTDENLLRRILSLILENASKFTNPGIVEMAVSTPDLTYARLQGLFIGPKEIPTSYVMFKISDTGIGIKEEDLNLIFDEYSIVEKTRKNVGENIGSGLNLPIAKKIIDILGGIIWVESELHKGSSFNFIIPVKSEGQETAVNE
jgi:PAS domain S-box-containing protein